MSRKSYPDHVMEREIDKMITEFRKGTHMHSARDMMCTVWMRSSPTQWLWLVDYARAQGVRVVTGLGNRPNNLEGIDNASD